MACFAQTPLRSLICSRPMALKGPRPYPESGRKWPRVLERAAGAAFRLLAGPAWRVSGENDGRSPQGLQGLHNRRPHNQPDLNLARGRAEHWQTKGVRLTCLNCCLLVFHHFILPSKNVQVITLGSGVESGPEDARARVSQTRDCPRLVQG